MRVLVNTGTKRFSFKCILDGRGITVPGYENGHFVGPTILTNVKVACLIWLVNKLLCLDRLLFMLLITLHV